MILSTLRGLRSSQACHPIHPRFLRPVRPISVTYFLMVTFLKTPSPRPEIRFAMNGLAATQLFPEAASGHRGGSGGFLLECHEVTEALDVIAARST